MPAAEAVRVADHVAERVESRKQRKSPAARSDCVLKLTDFGLVACRSLCAQRIAWSCASTTGACCRVAGVGRGRCAGGPLSASRGARVGCGRRSPRRERFGWCDETVDLSLQGGAHPRRGIRSAARRRSGAGRAHLQRKVALAVGAAAPRETGARSVRPSRGRRFVKTCERDHCGFLRTRHPVAARRQRAGTAPRGRGGIRVDPGSSLMLAFHFEGRKPSVGSSALPAGGHLVRGQSPARLVRRAADGESTLQERRARACCVRSGSARRTTDGRRSSRRAARALRRARLTREGRRCVPFHGYRTAFAVAGRSLLDAGFALRAGSVSYPLEPRGSKNRRTG